MKSQGVSVLVWLVALVLPILFFTVMTDNLNERMPVLPFIVCPLLFAGAAWVTAKNLKWVAWGAFVGAIEALLLVFAV